MPVSTIKQQLNLDNRTFSVKIISPKQELFNGIATSVSSINSAGKFDILGEHGNFITLVENKPIVVRLVNKQVKTFAFPLAVIYARKNIVTIFTDIQLELLTS